MTCKDCIHRELCADYVSSLAKVQNADVKYISQWLDEIEGKKNQTDNECEHFADCSRFVELPCKVGDTVYAYWDMDNPCSNYLHVIEDFIIDLVILVDRKNSVIGFRAGRTCEQNGRKCDIEFDLKDIGKTVFLTREEAEQALKLKERE